MMMKYKSETYYLQALEKEGLTLQEVEARRLHDPMIQGFVNITKGAFERIVKLEERVESLELRLDRLEREMFGQKTEKTSIILPGQLALDLGDAEYIVEEAPKVSVNYERNLPKKKPLRQEFPAFLLQNPEHDERTIRSMMNGESGRC
jgi:hypothetical protein